MSIAPSPQNAIAQVSEIPEARMTVYEILEAAGLPMRDTQKSWIRAQAPWQSRPGYDLVINARTGAWKLNSLGEHGDFPKLLERLGLDPAGSGQISVARKQSQTERKEAAADLGRARALWRSAYPISSALDYRPPFKELVAWRAAAHSYLSSKGIPQDVLDAAGVRLRVTPDSVNKKALLLLVPFFAPQTGETEPTWLQLIRIDSQGKAYPWRVAGSPGEPRRTLGPVQAGEYRRSAGFFLPPVKTAARLLICEAPETGLALQAMTGEPVWCLADADGLENARIAYLASLPISELCVAGDHNADQSGQRAAEQLARDLQNYYPDRRVTVAIPPQTGNWWDVLDQQGPAGGAVTLKQATVAIEELAVSDSSEYSPAVAKNWKPATKPRQASTVSVDQAQKQVESLLLASIKDQARWVKRFRKQKGKNAGAQPPHQLLEITTGTGKSHALRKVVQSAVQQDVPVFILTANLELAKDIAAETGAILHRGRTYEPGSAYHCHQAEQGGLVSQLGEARRQISAIACSSCPHAARNDWEAADATRRQELENRAQNLGWQPLSQVAHCDWRDRATLERTELIVTGAKGSLAPAAAQFWDGHRNIPRLLIIDEEPEILDHWQIRIEDTQTWLRALQQMQQSIATQTVASLEEKKKREQNLQTYGQVLSVLETLLRLQTESVTGGLCSLAPWPEWDRLAAAMDWIQDHAAPHEKAVLRYGQAPIIPLRAFADLTWGLQHHTASLENGTLFSSHPNLVGERLLNSENRIIILSATPSKVLSEIVQAKGGQHHRILVEQNLELVEFPQRAHLRGGFHGPQGVRRKQQERGRLTTAIQGLPGAAVITHKPLAEADEGYFGRDHIGHNRYKDKSLIIFGDPVKPPEVLRRQYSGEQAIAMAAGADGTRWPNWDPRRVSNAWVTTGAEAVQSRVALPAHPEIQDWWLEQVEREIVQAVGRVRGTRAATRLSVQRYGGVPVRWYRYGLRSEYQEDAQAMGRSRHDWALEEQSDAVTRVFDAVRDLEAQQVIPSRRKIASLQRRQGREQTAPTTYQRLLEWAFAHRLQPGPAYLQAGDLAKMLEVLSKTKEALDWNLLLPVEVSLEEMAGILNESETGFSLPWVEAIALTLLEKLGAVEPPNDRKRSA